MKEINDKRLEEIKSNNSRKGNLILKIKEFLGTEKLKTTFRGKKVEFTLTEILGKKYLSTNSDLKNRVGKILDNPRILEVIRGEIVVEKSGRKSINPVGLVVEYLNK